MNILLRFIVFCLDPLGIERRFFIWPAYNLAVNVYNRIKAKTDEKVDSLRELILRLGLVAFAVVLIIWAAIFMYAVFYYFYMPAISHTRPVHMQFKTCLDTSAPCTFPHAHVSLTKKQQLLMVGQAYRVIVQIEMPESPQNLDLGMFMVCGEMRDHESVLRGHSCRSAMMRYRSPLIRTLTTWALSPLFVLGVKEEFQHVPVEIFSRYLEQKHHPITDVYVEIQSQRIQYYTVSLHIVAEFTGLRYIMYNYPVISAIIAISTNLFFLLVVFLLSWYNWSDATWLRNLQKKINQFTSTLQHSVSRVLLPSSKSAINVQDEDELSFLEDEKSNVSEDIDEIGSSTSASKEEDKTTIRQRKLDTTET